MTSEDFDRAYLERTHKIAEENALPEVFQTLFAGGMSVLDGSFDMSLIDKKVKVLRERLSTESWADKGTVTFDLNRTFPGSRGTFTAEYDSEIDRNLLDCLRKNAYPDADEATLLPMVRDQFKSYRRIKSFTLENEKHVFDLRTHVPEDWSVYAYIPSNARLLDTAFVNTEFHFIMSPQPIDSRLGIHGLFHEVGHVVEDKELTPLEIEKRAEARGKDSMSLDEKKELIQSERKANAFALTNLRHFFGHEDIDIFRQLTYTGQRGYHRQISKR